jgi:hypothetical protein
MPRPDLNRVPSFYHNYIAKVQQENLVDAFIAHQKEFLQLLETLPADKWDYKYAKDKWTIKELVQHVIDAERIFSYRVLCFARNESASLPGFNENSYAAASKAFKRKPEELIAELKAVQQSTTLLFSSFDEDQLEAAGTANNSSIYVNAIGFIVVGHALHHAKILKDRYL